MNRSLIFVPAKEKMLGKIQSMDADVFIIDLEDSIEQDNKESALLLILDFLETFNDMSKIVVRLNKERYLYELKKLDAFDIGFMLPKFETIKDYQKINNYNNHPYYALVETPLGLVNIKDIVSLKEIEAIAFGAEDFTASVGMQNSIEFLNYQKSMLVTYAKAYNKKVYDTPSFKLDNYELFKEEVDNAYNLGFDGKMLITPKHLEYINKTFSACDYEYLKRIIDTYEASEEAVVVIDGKVYEKMHINHLKRILVEKGN